ncbi:GAF domain-containing protein [Marivirga arenosa]|uniref:GAF domain-containing protein n=1 Tax=Marivirga arenosa TaxID=3059076 RepID=A0AA51RCX4_9BACT|nr:GAF domain-containing protein [Marivirga sp. ABR2-2]WMN06320.1 GAF domain-containing protein [Marivirga sp. ABR2-2]
MKIRDLAIRKKFILAFSILLIVMLSGACILALLWSQINNYQKVKSDMAEIMMKFDKAQKIEQDFLIFGWKDPDFLNNGKSKFTLDFFTQLDLVEQEIQSKISSDFINDKSLSQDFHSILTSAKSYRSSFDELRKLLLKRGFRDHGLEGEMRTFVHEVQECISAEEKVFAFSLRRHEKDFALRKDMGYVDKLHNTTDEFISFIENAKTEEFPHMINSYKRSTINAIRAYRNHFDKIVQTEIEIGLNERSGQFLELNRYKNQTEPQISLLYSKINSKYQEINQKAFYVVISTFIILLVTIALLVFYLRKTVSKPIIKLDNITKKVLSGDSNVSKELNHQSVDEIGSLYRNFHQMLENLEENLHLIKEKNQSLEKKNTEDLKQNWIINGLSHISDLMKSSQSDLKDFSYKIISEVVKYIDANQGAFFILNDSNDHKEAFMELKGSYAFDRRKYIKKEINKGQGLVGQSWLEGDILYLTEVPTGYVNITSGLGEAPPRSIIIVPLKTENQILGVLEIASFKALEKHEKTFLKELSLRLGAVIESIKMQEKTNYLLKNSQEMTEQLRSQEEEMRQNMEELQATQEEMSRNEKTLHHKINFKNLQIDMMDGLLGKVYEGVLFFDHNFRIISSNNYVLKTLSYSEADLSGNHPDLILKSHIEKEIESLYNDPSFILTGVSERKESKIMDKYGSSYDCRYVLTKVEYNQKIYYSILFNKTEAEFGKKVLKHLFQTKKVNI